VAQFFSPPRCKNGHLPGKIFLFSAQLFLEIQ